ncbi:formin 1 [Sarotherodon galilaeus]
MEATSGQGAPASLKKYLLCQMPAVWADLPSYSGPPAPGSIGVYTKRSGRETLRYRGYIYPSASTEMPLTAFQHPFTCGCKRKFSKYTKLLKEFKDKEAETEEVTKLISEIRKNREMLGHATTSSELKHSIQEDNAATSGREIESEPTGSLIQHVESDNVDPLQEILDESEPASPVWFEEFQLCYEPQ